MNRQHHSLLKVLIKSGLFIVLLFPHFYQLTAQDRCAVPQILAEREKKYPELSTKEFEHWLSGKEVLRTATAQRSLEGIVQIPVVFHIIHNGEPIGTGTNLLKSRIDRQLEILNEDFNRQNADAIETLAEFRGVAATFEIEFVYAKQTPDGFETNGIVRVPGSQASYSYNNRAIVSSESYWPAEQYLNIWVADLSGGTLGWAEFPVSNLAGLQASSNNRLIDGVTIDYEYLGENPNSPVFESKGRTLTHEMGHFFGLRHIWGDGACSMDDFCLDTPTSSSASSGCNLSKTTCESLDMVQNFMDYSNDACMNIFTEDQKSRVRIVVDNSPRRKSLTTSKGLELPPVFDRDIGLVKINSRYSGSCSGNFTPRIIIKNFGTQTLAEYKVKLYVNGSLTETKHIMDSIQSEGENQVVFSILNFSNPAKYTIFYQVSLKNGVQDQRLENNQNNEYYQKLTQDYTPYTKKFNASITPWQVRNTASQQESWQLLDAGLSVPIYSNRQNFGGQEEIISPVFDFSNMEAPEVSFTIAQSADSIPNKLQIYTSYDCGKTFDDLIFSSTTTNIATAYAVDSQFKPQFRLDWDTVKIDLKRLQGETSVCFKIVAENRLSNDFYIRDFSIAESQKKEKEIRIVSWKDANPLLCDEPLSGSVLLENTGRKNITSFTLQVYKNGALLKEEIITNQIFIPGQKRSVELLVGQPQDDKGEFEILAIVDNQGTESIDKLYLPYKQNCQEELPPLRLSIKAGNSDNWYRFNPNKDLGWTYDDTLTAANSNSALISKNSSEDWLISPLLDVSQTEYLGLIFDIAYTKPFRQEEKLEIYISEDYGKSFKSLIYSKSGDSLATAFSNNENEELVWRNEFIDLSPYVFREKIRLAFKVTHDNGQNIYLRNITFFVGQTPPPPYPGVDKRLVIYPNPSRDVLNLHLNWDVPEKAFFQVIDMSGKVLLEFKEPKILNQLITFDVSALAAGMYILHLKTDRSTENVRFFIDK